MVETAANQTSLIGESVIVITEGPLEQPINKLHFLSISNMFYLFESNRQQTAGLK
jgi:hypothetical protein